MATIWREDDSGLTTLVVIRYDNSGMAFNTSTVQYEVKTPANLADYLVALAEVTSGHYEGTIAEASLTAGQAPYRDVLYEDGDVVSEKWVDPRLNNLPNLDVAVSTRSTPADIPTPTQIDAELSANHGSGPWSDTWAGLGDILVDHNYGGTDALRVTQDGVGIDGATIRAYRTTDYNAGTYTKRGEAVTGTDGRWIAPMMLDAGDYTLVISKSSAYQSQVVEITVS